jgi:hypothetical protein
VPHPHPGGPPHRHEEDPATSCRSPEIHRNHTQRRRCRRRKPQRRWPIGRSKLPARPLQPRKAQIHRLCPRSRPPAARGGERAGEGDGQTECIHPHGHREMAAHANLIVVRRLRCELASPRWLLTPARATATRGVDEGHATAILAKPTVCACDQLRQRHGEEEEVGWRRR